MKAIVVMPAYNAEETLEKTIADIPFEYVDEIILVDDASQDKTVALAEKIGKDHAQLTVSEREYQADPDHKILFTIHKLATNTGYGGNQKQCYRLALDHGADIVIMLHPDYQYDPKLVKYFVEFIRDGYFDVMLGSRIRSRKEALAGGMPRYKYYANRALSFIENVASGRSLSEWHTGMRAYSTPALKSIPFQHFSNDFVFDTQVLFALAEKDYRIGDIPVPVRYFKEASSINFQRSMTYGLSTLWEIAKFVARKYHQIFTYLLAGMTAALFNLAVYTLLVYEAHVWYIAAAALGFLCGAVVSFILQKYWTFNNPSHNTLMFQITTFLAIVVCNNGINSLMLFILVQKIGLHKLLANIISNGFVAVWTFFMYKHIAFKK